MHTRLAALAAAVVVVAGCGGESEDERLGRWQSQVDAVCREAQDRIADGGRPTQVRALDRVVQTALDDARAAIDQITDQPLPQGSEARVRPFVDALKTLRPRLDRLIDARDFTTSDQLEGTLNEVNQPLEELSRHARRAGLRSCAPDDLAARVTDALLAPQFVEGVKAAERRRVAALRRALRLPDGSRVAQWEYLNARRRDLHRVSGRFALLYPPAADAESLNECLYAIQGMEELMLDLAGEALRGRGEYVQARVELLGRRQDRACAELLEAVN